MQKSRVVNIKDFLISQDGINTDSSYDSFDSSDDDDKPIYSKTIKENLSLFKIQDFSKTLPIESPNIDDYQYNLTEINEPKVSNIRRSDVQIKCVLTMVSSLTNNRTITHSHNRSAIFMWENVSSILPSKYSDFVQKYFRTNYSTLSTDLRFFHQINPNVDTINHLSTLRSDVSSGRVLFHYIGYGFPQHDPSSIPCVDRNSGIFMNYSIRKLFDSIKTPSFFIFDCSNAGAALHAIQVAANSQHPIPSISTFQKSTIKQIDWNDYYCLCTTNIKETIPEDPHLPRDFLTSCIFTPVKLAVVCHVIQYYRTSIVDDKFPMNKFIDIINIKELNEILQAIIDSIASDVLHKEEYRKYFRNNNFISHLFRQFLLAQFLLRNYQVHPMSYPELPDMSTHPLWGHWKTIVDYVVTKVTIDSFGFITNLFDQTINSVKVYLKNDCKKDIPITLITLLFHIPEDSKLSKVSFELLAKYASLSQKSRDKLTKTTIFSKLFSILIKNNQNTKFSKHSLCYLCIALLQTDPKLIYEIVSSNDIKSFKELIFDSNIPTLTRSMICAILSYVISCNDSLRYLFTSKQFIINLKNLLNDSDSLFTLWILILIYKICDMYGINSKVIYDNGLHIQIASFCLHNSYEIRSAALSILSFFIQPTEKLANIQLFCLLILSIFDSSYLVRFNYIIFLGNFLSNYQLEAKQYLSEIEFQNRTIKEILNSYFKIEGFCYEECSKDFNQLSKLADLLCQSEDSLKKSIKLSIEYLNILKNDPHLTIRNISEQILNTFNYNEKGGNAVFNISIYQLVNSCQWELKEDSKPTTSPVSLPFPSISNVPTTKLVITNKYKFDSTEEPNHLTYYPKTLSISVSTTKNNVYYIDEFMNSTKIFINSKITSLAVSDWDYKPLVFIGTENGYINIWNPQNKHSKISFYSDFSGNSINFPVVLSLIKNKKQFVSSRGISGNICLWDIEYQKLIGEYNTGAKESVSAIAMNPISSNSCVAGFSNGLIVMMDLRMKSPQNVAAPRANDKIIKIVGCVDNNATFFAGTKAGACIKWDTNNDFPVVEFETKSTLVDFDAHPLSPFMTLAPKNLSPVIIDRNGKVIHNLKDIKMSNVCSFHPVLPHIIWGTPEGDLVESQLT